MEKRGKVAFLTVLRAYWLDWACTLILGAWSAIVTFTVPVTERYIPPGSTDFSYPMQVEMVSNSMLVVYSLIPVFIAWISQAVYTIFYSRGSWDWATDVHMMILTLLESLALSQGITSSLKTAVGRVRPSGIEMRDSGSSSWNLSYISGHASLAFTCTTFIALYSAGKVGLYRSDGLAGEARGRPSKFPLFLLLVVAPTALAIFIAVSRVIDYRHHFSDINAGAGVGLVSAVAVYFLNFPSLFSSSSHLSRATLALGRQLQEPNDVEMGRSTSTLERENPIVG